MKSFARSGAHLIIDAYNMIHAWPDFKIRLKKEGLESAQEALSRAVCLVHDVLQMRTTLVFDGKGTQLDIQRPTGQASFSWIFTPQGSCADQWVIALALQNPAPQSVWVASEDGTVVRALQPKGVRLLSAQGLMDKVSHAQTQQQSSLNQLHQKAQQAWRKQP